MMTPDKIASSNTESAHQKAFFAYCAVAKKHGFDVADNWAEYGLLPNLSRVSASVQVAQLSPPIPELEWIHHIPNGGKRDAITASNLKLEGVRAGVADIFWPFVLFDHNAEFKNQIIFSGLYIEMKKPDEKDSKNPFAAMSEKQIKFKDYVTPQRYKFEVCYSWQEAVQAIKNYYHGE